MRSWLCPLLQRAVLAAACVSVMNAREKTDLARIEPVPETAPIPIQDFFRPALLRSPSLNRAGTYLAALVTTGQDREELLVYNLETKDIDVLRGGGDKDIYAFTWLDDERLMFLTAQEKLYGMGMMIAHVRNLRRNYAVLQYCGARLIGVPERNRRTPLVWMSSDVEDGKNLGVAEIDTNLNLGGIVNLRAADTDWSDVIDVRDRNARHVLKSYPLPRGALNVGYLCDRDGELAFAFTHEEGYAHLHRFDAGGWKPSPIDLDAVDIVGAGETPGQLVVVSPREPNQPRALRFMDAASGEVGELLVRDKAYDFEGYIRRDFETRSIVGAFYHAAAPKSVWFDEGYRTVQKLVEASFPGMVVRLQDRDTKGRFFVEVWSDRQPSVYYQVDLKNHSLGLIKASAPWIDPKRMQPMGVVKFTTDDGRELDAYLTLPAGASKKNPAPLVVLPHGGPWVRDVWGFNPEVQFLANRGYAVLQPNYRGSPGYDWRFPEEDRWDFRKMHDDVTAATKKLVASGLVDAKRVAIMGASFGAYLALSGVVNEPELYRCAVTIAGVFDWAQVLQDAKYDQFTDARYAALKRRLGDPKQQQEKFDAISPVRRADRIRVPVFVSHGKDDPIANVGESKRLIDELAKNRVPHETYLVRGEGHGMARLEHNIELYSRIEAFLAKHLAP